MPMEIKSFDTDIKVGEEGSEIAGVELGEAEFVSIMSDNRIDRDGEIIDEGAFEPLPKHIVIDADHDTSVRGTVAAGRPFTDDDGRLLVHGKWATGPNVPLANATRDLVNQGIIKNMSVRFHDPERKDDDDDVTHIVKAELLNAGFVAVPANTGAEILGSKSLSPELAPIHLNLSDVEYDMKQLLEGIDVRLLVKELLPEIFSGLADPDIRQSLAKSLGLTAEYLPTQETSPQSDPVDQEAAAKAAAIERLAHDRQRIQAVATAAKARLEVVGL